MVKDRSADRHVIGSATSVSARLDPDDFRRFESARTVLGLNKRKALIAAIRHWLDATDKHAPSTETPEQKP